MVNITIVNLSKKFITKIDQKYKVKFAYLFGSTARGKERKESDIDIALYFEKNYSPLEDTFIRGELIDIGTSFFNKNVDVISLNSASLLLKYEIIHDGIVLKDNDERASFESLSLREYFDYKYYSDIYNQAMIDKIKNETYFGGSDNG